MHFQPRLNRHLREMNRAVRPRGEWAPPQPRPFVEKKEAPSLNALGYPVEHSGWGRLFKALGLE